MNSPCQAYVDTTECLVQCEKPLHHKGEHLGTDVFIVITTKGRRRTKPVTLRWRSK